jgi:uncharacterized phage protein gp47/JayE
MPSPDLRRYTDLVLYDRDPIDLVDRAKLDAAVKLPGWVPREGNTELVLIQAMALEVAELVFAVNRLPGAVVEVLLRIYGIIRSLGTPPEADLGIVLSDDLGHELPAGTRFRLDTAGGDSVVFATDAGVVVPPASTTATVPATGETNTEAANGTAELTELTLVDPVPFLESAHLVTVPSGGTGPESDAEWRDRAVEVFSKLVSTLVLPSHFTSEALAANPDVYRATTIDNWNVGAAANGHVTVAVLGEGGLTLSAGRKTEIEADLEAKSLANLDVHVIDPTITAVDVTVTVKRLPGYADGTVDANINAALGAYLSPDSWGWSGTVRRFELVAIIDAAEGVDYVDTLTAPAADVPLSGVAPLADLGTVIVTVLAP